MTQVCKCDKKKTYCNNDFVKNYYFSSDLDQRITHLIFEMFICHFVSLTHNIHHTTDKTDIEL